LSNLRQSIFNNSRVELTARWILGLTFIYASLHKILSPADFAKIVYGYSLFPEIFINLIAIIIPFLELVTGFALIIGFYPRSAAITINGLLLAFIVAKTINLIRGHEFDCGCFSAGQIGHFSSPKVTIALDIFSFILGLQVILFAEIRKMSIKRTSP
jgi:putative oxidoreductase